MYRAPSGRLLMKPGKLFLLIIPILVLAVWYGVSQRAAGGRGLPPLQVETVEYGDVSQRVIAHGSIQPLQTVIVGSQVSGIVDQATADFNSTVRRGQVIARIEPSTFEAAVSSAGRSFRCGMRPSSRTSSESPSRGHL